MESFVKLVNCFSFVFLQKQKQKGVSPEGKKQESSGISFAVYYSLRKAVQTFSKIIVC